MLLEQPRKSWARDLAALINDNNRAWLEAFEQGRISDAAILYSMLHTTMTYGMMWVGRVITRADAEAIADYNLWVADRAAFESRAYEVDPCNTMQRRGELHEQYHSLDDLLTGMEQAEKSTN